MSLQRFLFKKHLEEGEGILFVAHKHWFFFLKDMIKFLFFGVAFPIFLAFIFPVLSFLSYFLFGASFIIFLLDFCNWYYDAWIVTDMSIIDVEWISLFERRSSRVDYEIIEGISYEISGFFSYLLGFADIHIDRPSSGANPIILRHAASPKKVELELIRYRDQFLNAKNFQDEESLKDILTSMIRRQVQREQSE